MLEDILRESSLRHAHLCPRQVLGARMGLHAGELLNLDLPRADKRLHVIAETDGCAIDGLIAATGCRVGGRTLHILDFGKVAAIFTDTHTGMSIRIAPSRKSRSLALEYAPQEDSDWKAMLLGYQLVPLKDLFVAQEVQLINSLEQILSSPGKKAVCETCGEEIMNGREVVRDGIILCKPCAGEIYYFVPALPSRQQDTPKSSRY